MSPSRPASRSSAVATPPAAAADEDDPVWRALVNAPLVPFTDEELAAIAEAKGDPRPPRTHAEIEAMIAERARTER